MSAANVFPLGPETLPRSLFGRPTRRSYRSGVAQIVRDLKATHRLSNEALADVLGCHEDTIKNAENESGDLNPITLLSIAYAYGETAIEPVRQLYLCAPPRDETTSEKRRRLLRELQSLEDVQ